MINLIFKKTPKNINRGKGKRNKLKLYRSIFIQSDKGRIATKKTKFQPESQKTKPMKPHTQQSHTTSKKLNHKLHCDCVGFCTSLDNVPDLLEIWTGLS